MITNRTLTPEHPKALSTGHSTRHARKCSVCHHPDREEIDRAFLHWVTPLGIAEDYQFEDPRPIYRHAHATGLYLRRRTNVRSALEHIIEKAQSARVTGDTVTRAIRAHSCLSDDGRWSEPPKRTIVTRETISSARPDSAPGQNSVSPGSQSDEISNRPSNRLETTVTSTKQTDAPVSNRQKTASLQRPGLSLEEAEALDLISGDQT
jgi:hypothetical protein